MGTLSVSHGGYAWMIERRSVIENESSTPVWWDGREFSPDPCAGIRFARKEDAEKVIGTHGLMHATATDHEWTNAQIIDKQE